MKKGLTPYLFFLLLLCHSSFSQEYSYTHYDINDGLAGSTVYCMTQDKDGFIWTGTETGVSRFDGTHFLNFTTMDGLPDAEVLNLFCDTRGRVWMAPFSRSICYYYMGKIYNADNDPLLRRIRLKGNIEHFAEDPNGNILIGEKTALHLLHNDGRIEEYDSIDNKPIVNSMAISNSLSGHFLVQVNEYLYELSNGIFSKRIHINFPDKVPTFISLNKWIVTCRTVYPQGKTYNTAYATTIESLATEKKISFLYGSGHIAYTSDGDSLAYMNKTDGSFEYNIRTGSMKHFLPGISVSDVFRDDEGDTWFTTLGHGIYRLNSEEFRNIELQTPEGKKCGAHSIKRIGNELFIGSDHFFVFHYLLPKFTARAYKLGEEDANRIMAIDRAMNGDMVYGTDYMIVKFSHDFSYLLQLHQGIKTSIPINGNKELYASADGVFVLDLNDLHISDILFHRRATSICYRQDTTYIGTLDGLYRMGKDGSLAYLGTDLPFFRKRITAIVSAKDGTLWIASYDAGLIGYRDGRVIATIGIGQGLTSNICRTLDIRNNDLWVGTDKGLNKIDLGTPGYRITHYTYNDGLGSDMINTIYADSSVVYVGTPAGLTYFDQAKVSAFSGCRLVLLGAIHSGQRLEEGAPDFSLPYQDNNIRFEYVGISYKSAGNILYRYRLMGLDSNWKATKETFLEYPTLSPGTYELQLLAVNKFGMPSKPLFLHFTVPTPFWRTVWFNMLMFMILLGLIFLYFSFRIKRIRSQQNEKDKLGKKIAEMEHMALQAQMNPHFVFNCLNSIQQLVFDQDIFAANKYITGLARLIRATLYNSTRRTITLEDEIEYLSGYLELEKLRFKDKMYYSIKVDPSLDQRNILIPPMLIQPYVENSMRHGLRHKTDGKGLIRVEISLAEGKMVFVIEDNGIGREKAAHFKTTEHIEYQSKGMSLTADRIRLINTVYGEDIKLQIIDVKNEIQQAMGTRVILEFPKFDQTL